MGQLFSDLSYSKQKALPIGRPIEALNALYAKKEADYNFVVDTALNTKTLLNNVEHIDNPNDVAILEGAKNMISSNMEEYEKTGDLENRVLDVKKMANTVLNDFGLKEIQANAQTRAALVKDAQERHNKGLISKEAMDRTIKDADESYTGVTKNPETGTFSGKYNMRSIPKSINKAEKIGKALENFKANGYVLDTNGKPVNFTDPNGRVISRAYDANGQVVGYMYADTKEEVTEADLMAAAISYANSDPEIQDVIEDDLYYEIKNITRNPATGERREMTVNDLRSLVGTKVSNELVKKYGLKNLDQLEEVLKQRNLTVEDVYKDIRRQQIINEDAKFGVGKESYVKYDRKYMQDWMLADALEASKNNTPPSVPTTSLEILASKQTLTSEDTKRLANDLVETKNQIEETKKNLALKKADSNSHPYDIRKDEETLKTLQRKEEALTRNTHKIISNIPEVQADLDAIMTNAEFMPGDIKTSNQFINPGRIEGININKGELERLVYKFLGDSNPTDEELSKYININETSKILELLDFPINNRMSPLDKEYVTNVIENEGRAGLDKLVEEGKIMSNDKDRIEHFYHRNLTNFRNRLERTAKNANKKLENGVTYTKDYTAALLSDMKAEDARNHPFYQLNYTTAQIPETNAKYFTNLSLPISGVNLETYLVKEFDIDLDDKDDNIDWSKGKLVPSLDMERADDGRYVPIMFAQIPVTKDGKTSTKQISVTTNSPTFQNQYIESLYIAKSKLENSGRNLTPNEEILMDKINTNLFNSTKYAEDLDNLDLYNIPNGESLEFEFAPETTVDIKVFKYTSPTNMSFYIGEGNKYWANNGKEDKLVTEEELESPEWIPYGANTVEDLKTIFANRVFNSTDNVNIPEEYMKDLVDITPLFGEDIVGKSVLPYVHKNIYPHVKNLREKFPTLQPTDAARYQPKYGAEKSPHRVKYGASALDFRTRDPKTNIINKEAIALSVMTPEQLRDLGIKNIGVHDGNHLHVEFITN